MRVQEIHHRPEAQPIDDIADRAAGDRADGDRDQPPFGAPQPKTQRNNKITLNSRECCETIRSNLLET